MAKKGLTIGKIRSGLYTSGKILGDVNSVVRGRVAARVGTRVIGPLIANLFSALIRGLFGKR